MIKRIRKFAVKSYIVVPLALCLLFVSCNTGKDLKPESKTTSGKDIFNAVLFADGPAASSTANLSAIQPVNELKKNQPKEFAAFIQAKNEIIKKIEIKNPNFFSDFKTDMESGVPERVQNALNRSAESILDAVGVTKDQVEQLKNPAFKSELEKHNFKKVSDIQNRKEEFKSLIKANISKSFESSDLKKQFTVTAAADTSGGAAYDTELYYVNYYIAGAYIIIAAAAVLVIVIPLASDPNSVSYYGTNDRLMKEEFVNSVTTAFAKK